MQPTTCCCKELQIFRNIGPRVISDHRNKLKIKFMSNNGLSFTENIICLCFCLALFLGIKYLLIRQRFYTRPPFLFFSCLYITRDICSVKSVLLRGLSDSCRCSFTKLTSHGCRDAPVRGKRDGGEGNQRSGRWDPCRQEDGGEAEAAYVCDSESG